jgi:hypothetical protein
MITIAPDYDLFLVIAFAMFGLRGVVYLFAGLLKIEKPKSDKCGGTEILVGCVVLLLAAWVIL